MKLSSKNLGSSWTRVWNIWTAKIYCAFATALKVNDRWLRKRSLAQYERLRAP